MKNLKRILLTVLLLNAAITFAQRDGKKIPSDDLDKVLKQKVMEKLSFDEPTADKLILAYKENNKQMRIINKERKDIMESIELNPEASDVGSKLDKMVDVETKMADIRKEFFNELKTFLTPQQIAKTLVIRKNFHKELRRQMKQRKSDKTKKPDKDGKKGFDDGKGFKNKK